jgi:hypothetical protein
MAEFLVVGVYENDLRPYATTVEAEDPELAKDAAQQQCVADNTGLPYEAVPTDVPAEEFLLVGVQVIGGEIDKVQVVG